MIVTKTINEICNILDSRRIPVTASKRKPGPYPYYGANGIQGYVADYIFDGEYVLVAEDGGYFGSKEKAIAYRVSGKCWVNNHAHILEAKDMIDVDYLCYALAFYDTTGIVNGATRQKLTQSDLKNIKISFPEDIEEQRRIVKRATKQLATIDAMAETTTQQIADIRNVADKVIHDEITKYKIGEEPLRKIAKFEYGYTDSAKRSGTHRFIRITDISETGALRSDPAMYIDYPNFDDKVNLKHGDILVARTGGTYGKTMIFQEDYPAVFASFLIRISFVSPVVPEFYWHFSQSSLYWEQAKALVKGGTQPQFNANSLAKIMFPIVEIDNQKKVVKSLNEKIEILTKIECDLRKQQENLSALRACIFREAFGNEE